MTLPRSRQLAVYSLTLVMLVAGLPQRARAEIIDTQAVLSAASRSESLSRIDRALEQAAVRLRLAELGVERQAIDQRLAALTDAELASFAERLEQAPAGGDVLGILGITFLVLLILELVGVIDIFKTVGPPRR